MSAWPKVQGWPEEVKVQFYQASFNPDFLSKTMVQDDLWTLQGWIQLDCEVENCEQVVKLIQQQHQAEQKKDPPRSLEWKIEGGGKKLKKLPWGLSQKGNKG